jgi:ubiquinol-cytochrome c reductase cytochrome b subunit
MKYIFPDHWTFLFGEIALYSFIVLVATGVYLTLFFEPSTAQTTYSGSYAPLQGTAVSEAYDSTLRIVFDVPAGLLVRQAHHWAALVFMVAIVAHLMRVFFTGAFRKPRDANWLIGVTLAMLGLLEGFAGYSLADDLLSGMGLAIAYGVALSIPFVGGQLAVLIWDGAFPGGSDFISRLFITHVLILPVVIAVLITLHLAIIMRQKHSQFPGPGRTEQNVIGSPLWPAYTFRAVGMMLATAAVLFLLGGLIQINPIWQWGPFHTDLSTNGAQPDWYLGWLIGALRLMPPWEPVVGDYTLVPNAFWGGAFFPLVVFAFLFFWPSLERRVTRDYDFHHLLDRPRDKPWRTGVGVAFFTWVGMVFFAGSSDRVFVAVHIDYASQVHVYQALVFVLPLVAGWIAKRICEELLRSEAHPLRGPGGGYVRRRPTGGFETVSAPPTRPAPDPSERT